MADLLPEPAPSEARAVILGIGLFWGGWGLSSLSFTAGGLFLVFIPVMLAGYLWLVVGARRWLGRSQGRSGWGWWVAGMPGMWRLLMPGNLRRAARVLGWSERIVLVVLGGLLLTDLVTFAWMLSHMPASQSD